MSHTQFSQYASGITESIAAVAGVPAEYVSQVSSTTTSLSSSSNSDDNSTDAAPSMLVNNAPAPSAPEGASVPESAPSQLPSPYATAPGHVRSQYYTTSSSSKQQGSGRHLLSVEVTIIEYAIKSNSSAGPWGDPVVIRRKFLSSAAGFGQASSAGFGKGFYATLAKNGVPYEPTVYLDGVQILAGGLTTDAPKSRFGSRHQDDPKIFDVNELTGEDMPSVVELRDVRPVTLTPEPATHQGLAPWIIGVIVAAAVLALALAGMLVWRCCSRSRECADDASQTSTERQFITQDGHAQV